MFVWCAYCHSLQREVPPFFRYSVAHTICTKCGERMKAGEEVAIDATRADYFSRLIEVGKRGDLTRCREMRDEGLALGFRPSDLAFAAISGVLDEIGFGWECGAVSVAEQQKATQWCERFLEGMPQPPDTGGKLDLLGTVTPTNTHLLGPRLAEFVLRDWGIRAEVIMPAVPVVELNQIIDRRSPACVAISCGIPTAIPEARAIAAALHATRYTGRIIIVGPAVRRLDFSTDSPRIYTAKTLFDVREILEMPNAATDPEESVEAKIVGTNDPAR